MIVHPYVPVRGRSVSRSPGVRSRSVSRASSHASGRRSNGSMQYRFTYADTASEWSDDVECVDAAECRSYSNLDSPRALFARRVDSIHECNELTRRWSSHSLERQAESQIQLFSKLRRDTDVGRKVEELLVRETAQREVLHLDCLIELSNLRSAELAQRHIALSYYSRKFQEFEESTIRKLQLTSMQIEKQRAELRSEQYRKEQQSRGLSESLLQHEREKVRLHQLASDARTSLRLAELQHEECEGRKDLEVRAVVHFSSLNNLEFRERKKLTDKAYCQQIEELQRKLNDAVCEAERARRNEGSIHEWLNGVRRTDPRDNPQEPFTPGASFAPSSPHRASQAPETPRQSSYSYTYTPRSQTATEPRTPPSHTVHSAKEELRKRQFHEAKQADAARSEQVFSHVRSASAHSSPHSCAPFVGCSKLEELAVMHARAKDPKSNYFVILGVPEADNIDLQFLGRCYKKACLKWHPDKWCSESEEHQAQAECVFKTIQEAYSTLKDPEARLKYTSIRAWNQFKERAGGQVPHPRPDVRSERGRAVFRQYTTSDRHRSTSTASSDRSGEFRSAAAFSRASPHKRYYFY